MPAPLRIGLLGCGRIARMFHLPILRDLPGAHLVAIAERDPDARRMATTAAPMAACVADVEAVLSRADVDAVVVALPSPMHGDVATAAFSAGKHVYIEKPLAVTLAEADRIRQAWRTSGRVGHTGFNLRFHPRYREARSAVVGGALGRPSLVVRSVFTSSPRELPGWKRRRVTGGGALLDLASHHVDLLRFLLDDEVVEVGAQLASRRTDEDTATLQLRFETGHLAQLVVTSAAAQSDRVEVLGDLATLRVDRMGRRSVEVVPSRPADGRLQGLRIAARILREGARATFDGLRPPPEPSFASALGAFVATANGGHAPDAATIEDGYRCLEILDAADRAAATRGITTVEPSGGGAAR